MKSMIEADAVPQSSAARACRSRLRWCSSRRSDAARRRGCSSVESSNPAGSRSPGRNIPKQASRGRRRSVSLDPVCGRAPGRSHDHGAGLEGGVVYALSRCAAPRSRAPRIDDHGSILRPDMADEAASPRASRARKIALQSSAQAAGLSPREQPAARSRVRPPRDPKARGADRSFPSRVTGLSRSSAQSRRPAACAGGRRRRADARRRPGVFVAGEMLDWEAPTGGYLLQASFAPAPRSGRAFSMVAAETAPAIAPTAANGS